jgi:N-acetylmuramoyl-L-alanine amidase
MNRLNPGAGRSTPGRDGHVSVRRWGRDHRQLRAALVAGALAVLTLAAGCGRGAAAADARWSEPLAAASLDASTSPAAPSPTPSPSAAKPSASANAGAVLTGPLNLAAVSDKVIAIDPGHNDGNFAHPDEINKQVPMGTGTKECDTTGTQTNGGYHEAAFTFDVANRLAALLRAAGANVVMTRTDDNSVGPCVNVRAQIGNDAHAAVAISIHADGAPSTGHGFHVMEPKKVGAPSDAIITQSNQLALLIRDNYRARTGIPASNYIGTNGINPRSDMGGLNLSTVPKVLLECGNMRNAGDAAMETNPTDRQKMAEGIAAGLAAYLAAAG